MLYRTRVTIAQRKRKKKIKRKKGRRVTGKAETGGNSN